MTTFSAVANERYDDVAPNETVGSGAFKLQVKILDPVTKEPWVNKAYRIIVYDTSDKAVAVMLGKTDNQGYTATLKTSKPATDFIARPRVQAAKYPFITQLRLQQRASGKTITNAQYIHFFSDGTVFTGISDERGDTAEIGAENATELKTQIQQFDAESHICYWKTDANLLNQTVDAKPARKIELIKQVLAQTLTLKSVKNGCVTMSHLYGDYLVTQLLNAAIAGGQDLLNATAPLIVNEKTQRLISDNLDDNSPSKSTYSQAELRVKATLNLLEDTERSAVSQAFTNEWVGKLIDGFNGLEQKIKFEDDGKFLNLAEAAIWRKDFVSADKLVLASKEISDKSIQATDFARQMAVLAMIAKSKGDTQGAQTLFEDANNWLAGEDGDDMLAKYRAEFNNVPFGKMRISAEMLTDAKQWCPKIDQNKEQLITLFSMDEPSTLAISRVLTLDALMTHGSAKAGKVTIGLNCNTGTETYVLTQQDIAQIRAAISLGGIIVIGDEKTKNYNAQQMQQALIAWLQTVKLKPGFYAPNKIKQKLNIGF